jgi:hypothetical protein
MNFWRWKRISVSNRGIYGPKRAAGAVRGEAGMQLAQVREFAPTPTASVEFPLKTTSEKDAALSFA